MCNVALIGQVISTSLNKEQKKKQGNVMAILNVIIGSVPAPPIYGLILDRWGEYDKHCAMRAYRNYLNLTLPKKYKRLSVYLSKGEYSVQKHLSKINNSYNNNYQKEINLI